MISAIFVLCMVGLGYSLKWLSCACSEPEPDPYARLYDVLDEIVDIGYKMANELSQMNMIAEGKRDLTDYDPDWANIPGMEKSGKGG